MIVLRNSKKAYRFGGTGVGLLRRSAMPTERRASANPQQLLLQAGRLSKHARELDPTPSQRLAIERLYGRVTACTAVSFAFQSILASEVRDWLHRADTVARALAAHGRTLSSSDAALLSQMRRLIDSANVAVMRGVASHNAWSDFCAVADWSAQSVESGTHKKRSAGKWHEK